MQFRSIFKNIIVVGTVAAVCAIASLYSTASSNAGLNLSSNVEIEQAFVQYIAKYGKSYSSKNELPLRFEAFSDSYKLVQAHNAKSQSIFKMELNQFADVPLIKKSLKPFLETGLHPNLEALNPNFTVPESVDWNSTGKLSQVYDQLTCNADWAISAIETLEAALTIQNNATSGDYKISINHLVDCDGANSGCMGGWPARAWKFFQRIGYVAPRDYFYQTFLGVKRTCASITGKPIQKLPTLFKSRSYLMLNVNITKAFASVQPISVAVNAPRCLKFYSSGILTQADCECSAKVYEEVEVNELMTLIGYGNVQPNTTESLLCDGYWNLRTSFGSTWGENGHIRLCIPKNQTEDAIGTCNMQVFPMIPDVGLKMPDFI